MTRACGLARPGLRVYDRRRTCKTQQMVIALASLPGGWNGVRFTGTVATAVPGIAPVFLTKLPLPQPTERT